MTTTEQRVSSCDTVKDRQPDLRGIDNPSQWNYIFVDGIYRPYQQVVVVEVPKTELERLIDEHDPDMSDEELESMGITIKYKKLIGDDGSVDLRDGCGHHVTTVEEPKEIRKIGF